MKNLIIPTTVPSAASHAKDGALFIIREIPDDATPQGPSFTIADTLDGYTELKPRPVRAGRVPVCVERRAFRKALFAEFGVRFEDVRSFIDGITDTTEKELALIKFEEARTVRRDDELVEKIRLALGKTPEQTDSVFIRAAALV